MSGDYIVSGVFVRGDAVGLDADERAFTFHNSLSNHARFRWQPVPDDRVNRLTKSPNGSMNSVSNSARKALTRRVSRWLSWSDFFSWQV
jgi:hypothetical protein